MNNVRQNAHQGNVKKHYCCLSTRGVDWGGMGNDRGGMDDRGSVDDGVGNSDRGGNRGEGSGAVVGDLSDVTVDRVGVVVHVLDPAVGKGNRVGALSVAGTVAALSGVEVGVGVVVSDSVVVGVGRDLVGVHLGNGVGNGVGNSVGDHRGSVYNRGGMNNRGGMDHWGNSMSNSVAHYSMADNTVPNHSRGSEDLGGRRSGSCKGCESNEDL